MTESAVTDEQAVDLYCEVMGEGPPLVLLAGFGSDLLSWSFQRAAFGARFQTVLVDNRGVGRSPTPPAPYSIDCMVEDLRRVVQRLGLERFSLLGHSMGSTIAQEFALAYPDLVHRLVLVAARGGWDSEVPAALLEWKRAMEQPEIDTEIMAKRVLPRLYSREFLSSPNRLDSILRFMKAHPYRARAEGLAGQLAAVKAYRISDKVEELAAPTLFIAGAEDELTPPSLTMDLARRVPNSEFFLIEDAGHACMIEQADRFSEEVLKFLTHR